AVAPRVEPVATRHHRRLCAGRHPQVVAQPRLSAMETRVGDANNGERLRVDPNLPADCLRIGVEAASPIVVTDHGRRRGAGAPVRPPEGWADDWVDAEPIKEVGRDDLRPRPLSVAIDDDANREVVITGNSFE